jgi:hypothetical protein
MNVKVKGVLTNILKKLYLRLTETNLLQSNKQK